MSAPPALPAVVVFMEFCSVLPLLLMLLLLLADERMEPLAMLLDVLAFELKYASSPVRGGEVYEKVPNIKFKACVHLYLQKAH